MNSKDLVVNYLTDNEEGMKNLITWFLNEVMQREADELAGATRYERTGSRRTYSLRHYPLKPNPGVSIAGTALE